MNLVFREPPERHIGRIVDTLTEVSQHPGKWVVVAEQVGANEVQMWRSSRGRVGAQGEFTVRQVKVDDLGRVDVFVRYDDDEVSA